MHYTENVNTLKNSDTEKIIVNNYKKYLEEHNKENKEEDNCNDLIDKYYENIENVNNENNYSSNFKSSQSVDSEEEVIYDFNPFDDNYDKDNGNSRILLIKIKKMINHPKKKKL